MLASIAVTNFIGGLVFGLAFEWFGEQAGVGAAVLASHVAMSVWIPELMMAYNIGDWGTLLAVGHQFGGFVLAAVLGGIPWWEAPIAAGAAAAEEGSGAFAINIVAAAGGLAITLADMGSHGCFSGS